MGTDVWCKDHPLCKYSWWCEVSKTVLAWCSTWFRFMRATEAVLFLQKDGAGQGFCQVEELSVQVKPLP